MTELERFMEGRTRPDQERLDIRELRPLAQIAKELIEVGAGLPKEHVASHEDLHPEVKANRDETTEVEAAVLRFEAYLRTKRARADEGRPGAVWFPS